MQKGVANLGFQLLLFPRLFSSLESKLDKAEKGGEEGKGRGATDSFEVERDVIRGSILPFFPHET